MRETAVDPAVCMLLTLLPSEALAAQMDAAEAETEEEAAPEGETGKAQDEEAAPEEEAGEAPKEETAPTEERTEEETPIEEEPPISPRATTKGKLKKALRTGAVNRTAGLSRQMDGPASSISGRRTRSGKPPPHPPGRGAMN